MGKKKKKEKFHIPNGIMLILIFFFIVLMYDMLFGISFSTTNYQASNNLSLELPKYMEVSKEEDRKIQFKTFRSMAALSKDMKKIRKKDQRISCSDKVYYYNEKRNYSIAYQISRGILFNYLTIEYQEGKISCKAFVEPEADSTSKCKFRRTYLVDLVKKNDSGETIYVTLSEYQKETQTVEIPNIWLDTLEMSKNYVFTFEQVGEKKTSSDSIIHIFENYVLSNIEPTTQTGIGQIQEPICK